MRLVSINTPSVPGNTPSAINGTAMIASTSTMFIQEATFPSSEKLYCTVHYWVVRTQMPGSLKAV